MYFNAHRKLLQINSPNFIRFVLHLMQVFFTLSNTQESILIVLIQSHILRFVALCVRILIKMFVEEDTSL